jgi:hypothetical protein
VPPASGQGARALRGREEIAQLTARLRSEHEEYESASQSWSPEAEGKKRELRKARADTLVEIATALAWLGEVERVHEIERLPFEQKLVRLEAFLEDLQGGSAAPSPKESVPPDALDAAEALREDLQAGSAAPSPKESTPPDALDAAVDDSDAGWDDEEGESEAEWRGLTPEEREMRVARASARREKRRAKATEKAERRKARASIAKSKQKQKTRRLQSEPEPRRASPPPAAEPVANELPREVETPRAPSRRAGPGGLAFLVAIVLVAGGVALFLWRS